MAEIEGQLVPLYRLVEKIKKADFVEEPRRIYYVSRAEVDRETGDACCYLGPWLAGVKQDGARHVFYNDRGRWLEETERWIADTPVVVGIK